MYHNFTVSFLLFCNLYFHAKAWEKMGKEKHLIKTDPNKRVQCSTILTCPTNLQGKHLVLTTGQTKKFQTTLHTCMDSFQNSRS